MLQTGDAFPDFELPDQDGRPRRLTDLAGAKGLVFYVYPKDDTPGCTTEARDFTQLLPEFRARGYEVVGVSKDGAEAHCAFIAKHGLAFPLLTDADGELLTAIGAWGEKMNYGKVFIGIKRSTWVVAPDGQVVKAYGNVKAVNHAARVLKDLG